MPFNFGFGEGAYKFLDLLALFEQKHGGNALDAVPGCSLGVVVHIQFRNLDPPGVFCRQLIKDRRHHSAGTTPGRPTIHKNSPFKKKHLFFKGFVRDLHGIGRWRIPRQWCSALAAQGTLLDPHRRDPVLCMTSGALNNDAFLGFHRGSTSPESVDFFDSWDEILRILPRTGPGRSAVQERTSPCSVK